MCGIIEKGGAWYTVNGERFQGRAKAVAYLKENPNVVDNLVGEINTKLLSTITRVGKELEAQALESE